MRETTFIYALNDPETGQCRYIGKADNPKRRFQKHLREAFKKNTHKDCWIASLQTKNLIPVLEVLIEVPISEWEFWEQSYIRIWRDVWNDPLTNLTVGGDGVMTGRKHSLKTCSEMSLTRRGENNPFWGKTHSPEVREKLRIFNLGKKLPEAVRVKIGDSNRGKFTGEKSPNWGRKLSQETREKMSEAQKRNWIKRKEVLR